MIKNELFDHLSWRHRLLVITIFLILVSFVMECIFFFIYHFSGTMVFPPVIYFLKNIVTPLVINLVSLFVTNYIACKSKKESAKSAARIYGLLIPIISLSMFHYSFPEILLLTIIPMILSGTLGDSNLLRNNFIVDVLGSIPAIIFNIITINNHQTNLVIQYRDLFMHYLIVYAILIASYLAARITLVLEKQKIDKLARHMDNEKMLDEKIKLDSLTKLYNNNAIKLYVDYQLNLCDSFYIAMIDIDNFKKVNDVHGHLTGDNVISTLSEIIRKYEDLNVKGGRYGGDEFIVAFSDVDLEFSHFVITEINNEFLRSCGMLCSLSIGLVSRKDCKTAEDLITKVDKMLYSAKNGGKNTIIVE